MNPLQQALALKNELDALRPIAPELEARVMQKLRLDWNYHSNHLEGNSLNYGETKALLLFGITAQGKPLKDHFEITGHNEAIDWVLDVVKGELPLSESFIRQLHVLLLKEPYTKKAKTAQGLPTSKTIQVGQYKTTDNHVETVTGEMFYFVSALETPAKMADLIAWYAVQQARADVNPILLAAEFHYRFIRIHPFDDGNGRTARILMNFILMRFDYPPAVIKTEDKANYFAVLQQADAGLLEPFVDYIAQNVNRSLSLMIAGAKGEAIEEPDDLDKEIALLEQSLNSSNVRFNLIKNCQNLRKIALDVVLRCANRLNVTNGKFAKLYLTTELLVHISTRDERGCTIKFSELEAFIDGLDNTLAKSGIYSMTLDSRFLKLKFLGLENNDFTTEVRFDFDDVSYHIMVDNAEMMIRKSYEQVLSNDEIDNICSSLAKKHLGFIKEVSGDIPF